MIYENFAKWELRINLKINNNLKLQEMVDISAPIFENPIYILSSTLQYLAYTPVNELNILNGNQNINISINDYTSIYKDIIKNYDKRKPFYYKSKYYKEEMIIAHLYNDDTFLGILSINNHNRDFLKQDYELLSFMQKIIEDNEKHYHLFTNNKNYELKNTMKSLLNGEYIQEELLIKNDINYMHAKHICLCIEPAPGHVDNFSLYLCNQIEDIFSNSISFIKDKHIVALISLEDSEFINEELKSSLNYFLNKCQLKAGCSNIYSNLLKTKNYFAQAFSAIRVGSSIDKDASLYIFEDYALDYILSRCAKSLPAELICAKGILRLLEHDLKSNVSYCDTLRVYLDTAFNASESAKRLFIRRNTFLSRLERITKILKADINDPNTRLYFDLSLRLLNK